MRARPGRVRPAGDAALLLQAEGVATALAVAIVSQRIAGVLDVVPGDRKSVV